MRRLADLAVVAALLGSLTPAAAGPGDRALAALLACGPKSLAGIAESRAAFGSVTVASRPGSRAGATYELDEATFATPVEASGLHLFGFVRFVVFAGGRPRAVSFAFRTIEGAPTVARKVGEILRDVESQQKGDEFGWLVELEPEWHTDGDGSTIEHRHPLRMVLVSPNETAAHGRGATIECNLAEARLDKAPPPKLADLFAVAGPVAPPRDMP